ncbi:MAG: hypothetical protein A2254_12275 [Ignavibacteria bacterium RIFOXYA2_FULL_35_9]|nr:MAG: hypothetical protein A2254_12275 [Ignavibacteria bacterium RIFOXYA2_FULL_35_9]
MTSICTAVISKLEKIISDVLVFDNLSLQRYNKLLCVTLCLSGFVAKAIFLPLSHEDSKNHKEKFLLVLTLQSYLTNRQILPSIIIHTKKKII